MSNVLTAIKPTIYRALNTVSREFVGMIPAVARDSRAEAAAVGQTVTYHKVPASTLENITPGANPADSGDQTIGSGSMTISKSQAYPIRWEGEEEVALMNGDDPQLISVVEDQFAQAFRTIANAVELDLCNLHIEASRAFGTAGTTPFGTINELDDAAEVLRILEDNGSPMTDLHLVLGSAATAKLRGYQGVMFKDNEGQNRASRDLGTLFGMGLHQSGQIRTFTAGTGSSATVNNAGYAVGATVLTLSSAGTGTILAGDVVTFAGDTNQYVVTSGDADVSGGGTITIAEPGLKVAMSAATKAITVIASSARNMAFQRRAIQLVARQPAMPKGGDRATSVTTVTDPVSGLIYQIARYAEYRRVKYEVGLAWGVEVVNPEHFALLIG